MAMTLTLIIICNIKDTQKNNIKRCLQIFASIVFYYPFPPPFHPNVVGFIK